MGLGRWLRNKMEADDGYKPDPDEIVTVGYVSLAVSNIVLTELKAAGIRAEVVSNVSATTGRRKHGFCASPATVRQRRRSSTASDRLEAVTDSIPLRDTPIE